MKWETKATLKSSDLHSRQEEIIATVLKNRGLTNKTVINASLHPQDPMNITSTQVGIDPQQLKIAREKITSAINHGQSIIVYGDYDADGITATAILWETLHHLGANVSPFIPNREQHGYGLSVKGIIDAINRQASGTNYQPLVITVDNGITAFEAAKYCWENGIDLIITDHHQKDRTLPPCHALVHSDKIAGSAVAWFFAKELSPKSAQNTLELVTIGTVADMLPLQNENRQIVKHGLKALEHSQRPGLKALFKEGGIDPSEELSTYHINFIIAPRLNAMGRLQDAMDSLRLLCTNNQERANDLARLLADTNTTRQDITFEAVNLAKNWVKDSQEHILIVESSDFHEGVVGLIAGKLTETEHKPAIVINKRTEISKASARSITGVNIIELIRQHQHLILNAGGHPLAAGFTIETTKIDQFKQQLENYARENIDPTLFEPTLSIDVQITPEDITNNLFSKLEELKPFGMANPKPTFSISQARLSDFRVIGKESNHLKLTLQTESGQKLDAIGFGFGDKAKDLTDQTHVNLAFIIDENIWNGRRSLQLRLKDIKGKE